MKAYILHNSPKGSDHCAEGLYELISEKEDKIFARCSKARDGRQAYCKECYRKMWHSWRERHPNAKKNG